MKKRKGLMFILLAMALLLFAAMGPKATAKLLSPKIEKAQTYYEERLR